MRLGTRETHRRACSLSATDDVVYLLREIVSELVYETVLLPIDVNFVCRPKARTKCGSALGIRRSPAFLNGNPARRVYTFLWRLVKTKHP